jgi:signal transduction histidine kinase
LNYPDLVDDVAGVLQSRERSEREVESANGESYIVRINPYHSVDEVIEGAVLTFFDNTAQHRASGELREAKVLAESASVAKTTFLSTLSHELRTPLNSILGYADLLEVEPALTDGQLRKVERIKAGTWHLTAMIDEILSFAKLDSGHEIVVTEPIDARMIARDAAAMIEPAAMEKSLRIVVETPDLPLMVVTDPDKSRQILLNLGGNAVKYTHTGEIRLTVRGVGERVWFDIADSGIGIAPEHMDRIFERFWQVTGALTRTAGGMGIGLSAAREYARLLHGDVEVESTLGHGTTFRFWLPLVYDAG